MTAAFSRRQFIGSTAVLAMPDRRGTARGGGSAAHTRDGWPLEAPEPRAADDEMFWGRAQSAFVLDRSATYLNAAGVAPTPVAALDSMLTDTAFRNRLPAEHLWNVLEPRLEAVRHRLAACFGCDTEEIALTRNATEALQIIQLGMALRPGDEVLTTDHDFFRMLNTWIQRVNRDGIVLTRVPVPVPPRDPQVLVDMFAQAITPRTRAILFCHVTNVTGQIFPVREICEMARSRGVKTIVDGAQAFGHLPVDGAGLECDYYGGSLHKYMLAPLGTGFLYVRRELIPDLWPLTPAPASRNGDIRKFEDIGTHPAASHNAVAEAIRFRAGLGQENITARLGYLTRHWVQRLEGRRGVRLYNRFEPEHTAGIATVGVEGVSPRLMADELWNRFRIVTRPVTHAECPGVRVSPHVYNTIDEIEYFADAMTTLIQEWRT